MKIKFFYPTTKLVIVNGFKQITESDNNSNMNN